MTDFIGGMLGADAASESADKLSAGYKEGAKKVTDTQNENLDRITKMVQPYIDTGTDALAMLRKGYAKDGQFSRNFTLADLKEDPGYQFDIQQGNQAVQRSAAAKGLLNSGGTLKDISDYTVGRASGELSNAYNRFVNDQNNQFSRLSSLASLGSFGVGQYNQASTNTANTVSNAQYGASVGSAAAQAAGIVGGANAWSSAFGKAGNTLQTMALM